MALAHEIAVDKDFQLTKISPENSMESTVKEIMQRAFWDILKEQLEADPPVFDQVRGWNSLNFSNQVFEFIFKGGK